MRYLTLTEILGLHDRILSTSGGTHGLRALHQLETALAQPRATLTAKTSIPPPCQGHHALLRPRQGSCFRRRQQAYSSRPQELTLLLNGVRLEATLDDQERTILELAAALPTTEVDDDGLRNELRRDRLSLQSATGHLDTRPYRDSLNRGDRDAGVELEPSTLPSQPTGA